MVSQAGPEGLVLPAPHSGVSPTEDRLLALISQKLTGLAVSTNGLFFFIARIDTSLFNIRQ